MIQREADFTTKQESSTNDNAKISKASSSSTTTTSWSRFKDPRIVRVSKALGGKDRHSKVCTVRGLRDRRVRLSVPTAIQLYDLQDRLGLNQPSKVVDWLLNAAKHEIDELPPLQIPQGSFISQTLHPMLTTSHEFIASQSEKQGLKISGNFDWDHQSKHPDGKSKDVSGETSNRNDHPSWTRSEEQRQFIMENQGNDYVSTNSFSSRQSLSSLLSSATAPYNPFVRWDPSNLTLSHPPIGLTAQHEDLQNFSLAQLPSSVSAQPGCHQVLVYHQPGMSTQPYNLPSQFSPPNFHGSEMSNSSLVSQVDSTSTTQPVRAFQFSRSTTADLLPSQNNAVNQQNKHNELHSST